MIQRHRHSTCNNAMLLRCGCYSEEGAGLDRICRHHPAKLKVRVWGDKRFRV
jgi:hypothetical protein